MPFINGRYHINPAMGQALEDARSAADELLASAASHSSPDDDFAATSRDSADAQRGKSGPIHHVEIEAAEVLPSHTGRATHGFVARIHRASAPSSAPFARGGSAAEDSGRAAGPSSPTRPETHVFTDHRDLLDFLRSELSRDCSRS